MKGKTTYLFAVLFLALAIVSQGSWAYSAEKKAASKSEKAAVVNGVVITQADVDKDVTRFEHQMSLMGKPLNPEQKAEMKKKILDNLIDRQLLIDQVKKTGIKADDAEINQQISLLKQRFPKDGDFAQALEKMGITESELKSQLATDLSIKKMIDKEVGSKVTVSDEEARTYFNAHPDQFKMPERVRASHILIKVDPKASDADKAKARARLEAAQKRIQKGEDFAAVAKEVSECPSSAKGGDLDYFHKGQMVAPFEEAAFALQPGQLSGIVETQFGYHLIKVTDRKPAADVPFDQVKDRLKEHLKQEKMGEQMNTYLAGLRSKAKVETFMK